MAGMAGMAGKAVVGGFAVLGAGTVVAQTYKLYQSRPGPVDMERMHAGLKSGAKVTNALEARLGPPLKSLVLENSIEGENESSSLRTAKVLVTGANGQLGVLTSTVFVQATSAGKTATMTSCLFQPVALANDGMPEDLSLAPDPEAEIAASGLLDTAEGSEAEAAYAAALKEAEEEEKKEEAVIGFKGAMQQLGTDLRAEGAAAD